MSKKDSVAYSRGYKAGQRAGEYHNPFDPGYLADQYKKGFDDARRARKRVLI